MESLAIIGAQWGDEGKGKITDYLASKVDVVIRFQGGHNAGHTVWVNGRKSVTHLIPSGVLTEGVLSVIGHGVVLDPRQFKSEVEGLIAHGCKITGHNLKVSLHAPVITRFHHLLDQARERQTTTRIGTTGKGIGPAYEDKTSRRGIRVSDLFDFENLNRKITLLTEEKFVLLKHYGVECPSVQSEVEELFQLGKFIHPHVCDTFSLLHEIESQGKVMLYEGAQGLLLDNDYGTYPFVTSSQTHALTAPIGSGGAGPKHRVGVCKAYITRVGEGPMPTQIGGELEEKLRQLGNEFGATTGRARRCGWLDLPLLRYAVKFSQLTSLILTKCDVLAQLDEILICTHYTYQGLKIDEAYPGLDLSLMTPHYSKVERLSDINSSTKHSLSSSLKDYIEVIEKATNCPVVMVSYGVDRNDLYIKDGVFFT